MPPSYSLRTLLVVCLFLSTTTGSGLHSHRKRKREVKADPNKHPETALDPDDFLSSFLTKYSETGNPVAPQVSSYTTVSEPRPVPKDHDKAGSHHGYPLHTAKAHEIQPRTDIVTTFGTIAATVVIGVGQALATLLVYIFNKKLMIIGGIVLAILASLGFQGTVTDDLPGVVVHADKRIQRANEELSGLSIDEAIDRTEVSGFMGFVDGLQSNFSQSMKAIINAVKVVTGYDFSDPSETNTTTVTDEDRVDRSDPNVPESLPIPSTETGSPSVSNQIIEETMPSTPTLVNISDSTVLTPESVTQSSVKVTTSSTSTISLKNSVIEGNEDNQNIVSKNEETGTPDIFKLMPGDTSSSEVEPVDISEFPIVTPKPVTQSAVEVSTLSSLITSTTSFKMSDIEGTLSIMRSYEEVTDSPVVLKLVPGETEVITSSSLDTSTSPLKISDIEKNEDLQTSVWMNEATGHDVPLDEYNLIQGMADNVFLHEAVDVNEDNPGMEEFQRDEEIRDNKLTVSETDISDVDGVILGVEEEMPVHDPVDVNEFKEVEVQENIASTEHSEESLLLKNGARTKVNDPILAKILKGTELTVKSSEKSDTEVRPSSGAQYQPLVQNLSDFDWLSETSSDIDTPAIYNKNQPFFNSETPLGVGRDPVVAKLLSNSMDTVSDKSNIQSKLDLHENYHTGMVTEGYKDLMETLRSAELDLIEQSDDDEGFGE
eukprot:GFUD01041868.1.p1 GENE.GFUD01041868.1~~GFUD01041868.1.p1  ORF type:complete len:714 (+),score=139.19 GFUD01041868.1:38-2179(+)